MNGRPRIFLLLAIALSLAACADPGDDIPPGGAGSGKRPSRGTPAAQFELGSDYTLEPHRGWLRAGEWLRPSALQGFAPAQTSLRCST